MNLCLEFDRVDHNSGCTGYSLDRDRLDRRGVDLDRRIRAVVRRGRDRHSRAAVDGDLRGFSLIACYVNDNRFDVLGNGEGERAGCLARTELKAGDTGLVVCTVIKADGICNGQRIIACGIIFSRFYSYWCFFGMGNIWFNSGTTIEQSKSIYPRSKY